MSKLQVTDANGRKHLIHTENVYPPIGVRHFDWSAITDNYEPGSLSGSGETEQEAIADLLGQIEDED